MVLIKWMQKVFGQLKGGLRLRRVICCVRDGWKRFWWYYHNDPVKKCNLYINKGCAHVDGLLCNYTYCDMMQEYNREHGI